MRHVKYTEGNNKQSLHKSRINYLECSTQSKNHNLKKIVNEDFKGHGGFSGNILCTYNQGALRRTRSRLVAGQCSTR